MLQPSYLKWHSITFPEASYMASTHSAGDYRRMWVMEAGLFGSHPKSCLPHKLNLPDIRSRETWPKKEKKSIHQSQSRADTVAESDIKTVIVTVSYRLRCLGSVKGDIKKAKSKLQEKKNAKSKMKNSLSILMQTRQYKRNLVMFKTQ